MIVWLLIIVLLLWYTYFRYRRRHMYAMSEKVSCAENSHPLLGFALNLLGNTEVIMNRMKRYSEFTTEVNGIAKGWLGPLLYYMLTDPTKIEVVLKNNLEKDELHRHIKSFLGDASIFASVPVWRPRRKIAVPAFSPKIISNFVPVFSEESDKLCRILKSKSGTGKFKIWPYINAYSLDSVMNTAMGVTINAQEDQYNVILKAVNECLRLSCERIFHIWLQPDWLYWFFPQHSQLKHYTNLIQNFTDDIIRKRKVQLCELNLPQETISETPDLIRNSRQTSFLDVLINQSNYNNTELREEVMTFIVAGMDTSTTAMGFTLKLLGKYPKIQEKVFKELDAVFEGSDRLVERNDLPKLQYLERVIKESLRLFPPVPFIIRKAEEDTPLTEEITIPNGSGIIVSILGAHRNPKYWGPDAQCFDPDRFLPERCKNLPPCAYMPFSHGPRNCLGYQYAMMSMKTALASMLRQFRVVGEPETRPEPEIRTKLEVMMKAVDGFEVALEKR